MVVDWREVPAPAIAAAFAAERQHWIDRLRWDPAAAHAQIEIARTTWGLPGLAALDSGGAILGLTYYYDTGSRCEIGGVLSSSPLVTRALVSAIVHEATARGRDVLCFALDTPGLAMELARYGFSVEPFVYLERSLPWLAAPAAPAAGALRPWSADDAAATATLLRRAYQPAEARFFAPGHSAAAWSQYVEGIVQHGGCGTILPSVSRAAAVGDRLAAVSLVTEIAPDTVHLVQLAVDPGHRGSRLGTALLDASCAEAHARGYTALMLMAGTGNATACRLYARLGFTRRATFVAAMRPAHAVPTRVAS